MKNLTSLLIVLSISSTTMADNWPHKRLDRLYDSNPSKCLSVSKRYIKYLPDNPIAYYYASMVYRDKSKTHLENKTRYMMMSKSIGYAMKFEKFEDMDLEIKIKWDAYLEELQSATHHLVTELETTQYANFGDRLAIKHQKMVDNRNEIWVIPGGSSDTPIAAQEPVASNNGGENPAVTPEPVSTQGAGYFGLATGREITASYNKIQEQELLKLINEERKALFMTPLKWEEDLGRAARYHAHDMATQDYFFQDSYDRVDGELVQVADALTRNSQFHPKKHIKAQNIASGGINAYETFNEWMMYDEEYDVLFDESIKKVGIGICHDRSSAFGYYWVLVTAKR